MAMASHEPLSPAAIRAAIARIPRLRLAQLPTPLHRCERLSRIFGVDLYVKRDDLTGLAFGGNKTRNLEFRLAEARQQGADTIVALLEAHSNSARQTTAAANLLGMRTLLLLHGAEPATLAGNLLIDALLGAELRFVPTSDPGEVRRELDGVLERLRRAGHRPYVMNDAPMFAVGSALAYILCYLEIEEQLAALHKQAAFIYLSSGSKGQAGLVLAGRARQADTRIAGICARPDPARREATADIVNHTAELLGWTIREQPDAIVNDDRFARPDDADLGPGCFEAIRLAAREEGLLLDPVYTGRAMEGLIQHIHEGRVPEGATVVFIHTGGSPALFGFAERVQSYLAPPGHHR
jgi:D-cysteine desulfhydrase/L-cysteate sulfo-lyase